MVLSAGGLLGERLLASSLLTDGLCSPLLPQVPRKSILKAYNPDDVTQNFTTGHIGLGGRRASEESDEDEDEDDENETQFRRLPGESTTRMMDRRVSFAAHAHVRFVPTQIHPASRPNERKLTL